MSLSNLPPGVTDKMIDDYFSGPCEECVAGRHGKCSDDDCRCDDCDEFARDEAAEVAYERWKEERYDDPEEEIASHLP